MDLEKALMANRTCEWCNVSISDAKYQQRACVRASILRKRHAHIPLTVSTWIDTGSEGSSYTYSYRSKPCTPSSPMVGVPRPAVQLASVTQLGLAVFDRTTLLYQVAGIDHTPRVKRFLTVRQICDIVRGRHDVE